MLSQHSLVHYTADTGVQVRCSTALHPGACIEHHAEGHTNVAQFSTEYELVEHVNIIQLAVHADSAASVPDMQQQQQCMCRGLQQVAVRTLYS